MTDLYMPVMDGFELIEKIRAEERLKAIPWWPSPPAADAQERAMRLGVDIFLRKPVRFAEVHGDGEAAAPHQVPQGCLRNVFGRR